MFRVAAPGRMQMQVPNSQKKILGPVFMPGSVLLPEEHRKVVGNIGMNRIQDPGSFQLITDSILRQKGNVSLG